MADKSEAEKVPIYKKWWFWIIIAILIIAGIGANSSNNSNNDNTTSEPDNSQNSEAAHDTDIKLEYPAGNLQDIEKVVRSRVKEKYDDAAITKLQIFDETDNGTDDYTILVYLDWSKKNKSDTAKDMLQTYSSDLAAIMANEREDINNINIYWKIPYLVENGEKVGNGECYWIYTKENNKMVLKDSNWIYK